MSTSDIIKKSVLEHFSSDISMWRICITFGVVILLAAYIFIVYRMAVNNEFYSKDFNKTLALVAIVTSGIVLAIQSNIVISLGMVGALSIVRFRTAIKSPLDLFFLFWSISIGIISGAGLYIVAVALCIVVTLGLIVLDKIESPNNLGLIVVHCDSVNDMEKIIDEIKKFTDFCRLKSKTVKKNSVEFIIEYKTKKENELTRVLAENDTINMFSVMNYDRETRI